MPRVRTGDNLDGESESTTPSTTTTTIGRLQRLRRAPRFHDISDEDFVRLNRISTGSTDSDSSDSDSDGDDDTSQQTSVEEEESQAFLVGEEELEMRLAVFNGAADSSGDETNSSLSGSDSEPEPESEPESDSEFEDESRQDNLIASRQLVIRALARLETRQDLTHEERLRLRRAQELLDRTSNQLMQF
jgi:hypothetical protein